MRVWRADKWFSLCVRERAGWKCEACGREYPYGSDVRGLECSHYVGRASKSTRWTPGNCWALCTHCHFHFGGHPAEHYRFIVEKIGTEREQELFRKGKEVIKITKKDRESIAKYFKEQFESMRTKRDAGHKGRLEFKAWTREY